MAQAKKLKKILNSLMKSEHISENELAKKSGVPQPTINRLLRGVTDNPRKKALDKLASYFSVSIDQLIGDETITDFPEQVTDKLKISERVPLIHWPMMAKFKSALLMKNDPEVEWVPVYTKISAKSFAVHLADSSMEPHFQKDSLLVIDAEREIKDRDYVVVQLSEKEFILRQIIFDGARRFLKANNPDIPNTLCELGKNEKLIGVLAQALFIC